MTNSEKHLRESARVMKLIGWGLALGLPAMLLIYPPGFVWGVIPVEFCIGPPHPPSPYDGLHPYLFMLAAMYVAHGILLIRGAHEPKANAALFDYGMLANLLHALVMIPQSFYYPNEHAHMWADIPMALGVVGILWVWHPNRVVKTS